MKKLILDGQKLAWHSDRVNAWLDGERIAPITIDCALTRNCNYRCSYCYGQLQENDRKIITRDVIYRFIDDAAEIGVKAISLVSDGESTCSPHLYDAVARGKKNGLDMALGTNGYLIKEERLEELLRGLTYLRFNISAGEPGRYAEIMGCLPECFDRVCGIIRRSVAIKTEMNLPVTIGLQMVFLPDFSDQVMPLVRLGKELCVDYLVIKHCSDDETGSLGVDYTRYHDLTGLLKEAEEQSDDRYQVQIKWSKILSNGERTYKRCFGPPFILQMSGSGLVAPCGMLFNRKYSAFHIGNIADQSFRDIWRGERYWSVMKRIASEEFDAGSMCGKLCLQDRVNTFLDCLKNRKSQLESTSLTAPLHVNFI